MKKKIVFIMSIFLLMFFSFQGIFANTNQDLPKFVDNADLLTADEEQELNNKLNKISNEQKMDVVILTTYGLGEKTATQYADDFFDYSGYGQGDGHDGILLLVDMESRKWAISTTGYGIFAFTDVGQDYIVKQFKPYLSEGDYKKAFHKFADLSEDFIIQANKGEPYDTHNLPRSISSGAIVAIMFMEIIICFVIALFVGLYRKSKLKTVVKKTDALDYMESGSLNIMDSRDVFVNKIITSRTIPKNTTSGGSSTHSSSSGRSHGGSSGSF